MQHVLKNKLMVVFIIDQSIKCLVYKMSENSGKKLTIDPKVRNI